MPIAKFNRFFELQSIGRPEPQHRLVAWGLLAVVLWFPLIGGLLKSSMLTHMGVQVSLLIWVGHRWGHALLEYRPELVLVARRYRWALMLMTTVTLTVWMVPRLLDMAVESPAVDGIKAISLVLFAGVPLAWSWPQLPAVARGVIHLEALASLWRLGWLYLDSPTRLCLNYGLDDQQRLGQLWMGSGAAYALALAWWTLRGQVVPTPLKQLATGLKG
jgi:hypothetical protein